MRYDKVAELLQEVTNPDGYGGQIKGYVTVGTLNCILTPILDKNTIHDYGRDYHSLWNVITLDTISLSDFLIRSDGKIYRILEDKIYKRNRRVMLCEEV